MYVIKKLKKIHQSIYNRIWGIILLLADLNYSSALDSSVVYSKKSISLKSILKKLILIRHRIHNKYI